MGSTIMVRELLERKLISSAYQITTAARSQLAYCAEKNQQDVTYCLMAETDIQCTLFPTGSLHLAKISFYQ